MYLKTPDLVETSNGGEPEQVFCTADVQLCPDGSYVGRSGPNCEFSACPIPEGTMMEDGTLPDSEGEGSGGQNNGASGGDQQIACTMEAKLCPDGSYVGRSGPNCEFAKCP